MQLRILWEQVHTTDLCKAYQPEYKLKMEQKKVGFLLGKKKKKKKKTHKS